MMAFHDVHLYPCVQEAGQTTLNMPTDVPPGFRPLFLFLGPTFLLSWDV